MLRDWFKMTQIIDGKILAAHIKQLLRQRLLSVEKEIQPHLVVIRVGDDAASEVYVRNKKTQAEVVGIKASEFHFSKDVSEGDVLECIDRLNNDSSVHGILVQLPLPHHFDASQVIDRINPSKDVDGLHPHNLGKLIAREDTFVPCTPMGCLLMLQSVFEEGLRGKRALVIGRSRVVGSPLAQFLIAHDCTVTVAHRYSENLQKLCADMDIIVCAVGSPDLVKASWLSQKTVVLDVGITRISNPNATGQLLKGDVEFEKALGRVRAISPVPGGVGPMTIACLLHNTLKAYFLQNHLEWQKVVF